MKKTNKKGFKLPKYKRGGFWDNTKDLGLALADNALTTVTSGAGANIIKQDQYDDTRFGRSLGETNAIKESFDSMSPVSKMSKKFNKQPQDTGYTQTQQDYYNQAQPFAQMGSQIGEMWTMRGMSSMGNKKGTMAQDANGNDYLANPNGQGQNMFGSMAMQAGNTMYNSNGYAQGGVYQLTHPLFNSLHPPQFYNGGLTYANAEVEKSENTLNPDGTTTQFNGPSHDQGGIQTNLDPGTLIFSDRLKPKGSKETFANLNKPNNTTKEDKVLDNHKSDNLSKKTAELMKGVKNNNSLKLFNAQEALKEEKDQLQMFKQFMKSGGRISMTPDMPCYDCGGMHQYPDGGIKDNTYVRKPNMVNINKKPSKDELTASELEALAHQFRGMGTVKSQAGAYVKKSNGVINDVGYLTPSQLKQLQTYMDNSNTLEAIWQGLPNAGRLLPGENSFADIPADSKLKNQVTYKEGGKHWIQGAVNPKHKGYCTPMTKSTCTPHRKALALTFKKHHGFHKKADGGIQYPDGGPVYTSTAPTMSEQMLSKGMINPTTAAIYQSPNYVPRQGTEMNNPQMLFNINQAGTPLKQGTTTPTTSGTLPTFTYVNGQVDASGRPLTYQDQLNSYLVNNPIKAYGGVQMFPNGGRLISMESPEPELLHPNQFGYANFQDWNDVAKADYAMSHPTVPQPDNKKQGSGSNGPNWSNIGYQAGMWAANNLGEMAYLKDQGKRYDTQSFYNYDPTLLDPKASLRDMDIATKTAAYDLADKSSGHSGNYLSNRINLASTMALNKDKIRREYANANAGITNAGKQYNIQNKYMTDDINARNKGQALTNYYKSLGSMGTKTAQAGRDYKATETDQKTLDMMGSMFSNYKYDPKTNSWIFKK